MLTSPCTPLSYASIATQTANGIVSLKSPGTLNFNLTPTLLPKVAKLVPWITSLKLTQAALLQGTISQFSCPIPTSEEDLQKASFQANIKIPSQMQLTLKSERPLLLKYPNLSANSTSIDELIAFALSSTVEMQTQSGLAAIEGRMTHPFSQTGSVMVRATQLPVDLISSFVESPTPLALVLGPNADITGYSKGPSELHSTTFLGLPIL